MKYETKASSKHLLDTLPSYKNAATPAEKQPLVTRASTQNGGLPGTESEFDEIPLGNEVKENKEKEKEKNDCKIL
jgi:hypothetical protein